MTVAELIRYLSRVDPSRIVVLARDREGNAVSPLDATDLACYRAESTWEGWLVPDDASDAEAADCVVLWPVN